MFKMQIDGICIKILFMIFLVLCTIFDIRKKEIPITLIILGLISAISMDLWQVYRGMLSFGEIGVSFLIGSFFLLISFFTKEKVGYGDGMMLIISGLVMGFNRCFWGLCIGLIFASIFALLLLCKSKAKRDSEMPFVPFLTVGMGVSFLI